MTPLIFAVIPTTLLPVATSSTIASLLPGASIPTVVIIVVLSFIIPLLIPLIILRPAGTSSVASTAIPSLVVGVVHVAMTLLVVPTRMAHRVGVVSIVLRLEVAALVEVDVVEVEVGVERHIIEVHVELKLLTQLHVLLPEFPLLLLLHLLSLVVVVLEEGIESVFVGNTHLQLASLDFELIQEEK